MNYHIKSGDKMDANRICLIKRWAKATTDESKASIEMYFNECKRFAKAIDLND